MPAASEASRRKSSRGRARRGHSAAAPLLVGTALRYDDFVPPALKNQHRMQVAEPRKSGVQKSRKICRNGKCQLCCSRSPASFSRGRRTLFRFHARMATPSVARIDLNTQPTRTRIAGLALMRIEPRLHPLLAELPAAGRALEALRGPRRRSRPTGRGPRSWGGAMSGPARPQRFGRSRARYGLVPAASSSMLEARGEGQTPLDRPSVMRWMYLE